MEMKINLCKYGGPEMKRSMGDAARFATEPKEIYSETAYFGSNTSAGPAGENAELSPCFPPAVCLLDNER